MEAGAARKARVKFPDLQARPETRLLNTVVLINDAFEGVRRIMLLDAEHNRQLAFSCPEDVAKIRGQVLLAYVDGTCFLKLAGSAATGPQCVQVDPTPKTKAFLETL